MVIHVNSVNIGSCTAVLTLFTEDFATKFKENEDKAVYFCGHKFKGC